MKILVKSAIKRDDKIIIGNRHSECIKQAIMEGWEKPIRQEEQGFIDNEGNYYNRKEATVIAKLSGQINKNFNKNTLLSEYLW